MSCVCCALVIVAALPLAKCPVYTEDTEHKSSDLLYIMMQCSCHRLPELPFPPMTTCCYGDGQRDGRQKIIGWKVCGRHPRHDEYMQHKFHTYHVKSTSPSFKTVSANGTLSALPVSPPPVHFATPETKSSLLISSVLSQVSNKGQMKGWNDWYPCAFLSFLQLPQLPPKVWKYACLVNHWF